MNDMIYREDAIRAINCWFECNSLPQVGEGILYGIPSADRPQKVVAQITFDEEKLREIVKEAVERFKEEYEITDKPQGDVDAVDIFEREMHNLEQGYITIGEFDERIEPLRHLYYGRPQGKWIDMGDFEKCSVCKATRLKEFQSYYGKVTWIQTPYCPQCGARMLDKGINVPNKEGADDD